MDLDGSASLGSPVSRRENDARALRKPSLVIAIAALLPIVFTVAGCDPALDLVPVGWKDTGSGWVKSAESLEWKSWGLGGIISSEVQGFTLDITNRTGELMIMKAAELRTRGRRYPAELKEQAIPPGMTQRVEMAWYFDRSIDEVYGQDATVEVAYSIGSQEKKLLIAFSRSDD